MSGYQQGDQTAAAKLIHSLNPLLLRFFLSQYGNRAEAEDLVQDTWLRIHRARHTYRSGDRLLPWIYAIARHTGVDGYRRSLRVRARESSMPQLETVAARDAVPAIDSSGFDSLLAVLPPGQREVVAMLKGSGMSLEEVAQATASSVGAVKLKAHRAYEKLRGLLRPNTAENVANGGSDGL